MSAASPVHALPPARRMIAVMVLVPVLVGLALWAFAWPAARTAPRDLPIGVAGPPAAAAQVEQRLEQRAGAFDVHRYGDEATARTAVERRDVYGAVVVTPEGPRLLTASAASPAVAGLLREAVAERFPGGQQVAVTDVVPAPSADPRGGSLAASVLPLSLAGIAAGAMVTLLGLRGARGATALVGAAALVGITTTAVADSWLGVLDGPWWGEAGAVTLTALAAGAAAAALGALLGRPGIALGSVLFVLLGNPFSGAASAPELLPEPAGTIGQWLPPGAGAQLLRSVAYFDGHGAGGAMLTLSLWAVLGLAAVLLAGRRTFSPAAPAEHRGATALPVG
ncbi:ABC transporter permease [Streptomyces sp. NPDC004609]|uniref:ABC transporter permease n=1 Tax=Streptomyces sp. NPDC004609 TaxID=3364704 RepID=UPI0036AD841E